jgi:CheY-like chemotaxis protein
MWCFRDKNGLRMAGSETGPQPARPLQPFTAKAAPNSADRQFAMSETPSESGKACRILVVEDDALLAMALEDSLAALGHEVVGPARQIAEALRLAETERLDGAVLDLNIGGASIEPVAKILDARRVPFAFSTGYTHNKVPLQWRSRPLLQKPYHPAELEHLVEASFRPKNPSAA